MSKKEEKVKTESPTLKVKSDVTYRGARAEWHKLLLSFNGKSVDSFLEAAAKNPPTLPTKGKSAGKAEPPSGWLRFFVREGVATY